MLARLRRNLAARGASISSEDLERAIRASRDPEGTGGIYVRHRIPKKNPARGYRIVWDVNDPHMRDAHKAFARRFGGFTAEIDERFPHTAAFGYVRGRGIKSNAHQHCGHRLLLRCDIQDFFPTIDTDRLRVSFLKLGIQERAASLLASFATIEGTLALGLNASPLLANLVCLDLDNRLAELSQRAGCVYTRYADDISISGSSLPDQGLIDDLIVGEGFSIATAKSRITKLGQAHFVTGLSISDPKAPHVPRSFKRRLRQELYYCEKHSIAGHLARTGESFQHGINRIDGTVHFVASVESAHAGEIRRRWRSVYEM